MTQDAALAILKTGANVFLTGAPGAGKTHTLNQYVNYLRDCDIPVAITASTGIAATHIGGMTIHAWSGVGIKKILSAHDLDEMTTREKLVKRVKVAKVLVIDEISMLDGRVLDAVDMALRALKGTTEPFGGMQVILVGDFFQLPPIADRGDVARFAFDSQAWRDLQPLTCYLTEQHRQEDETLLSILGAIRDGTNEEAAFEPLLERINAEITLSIEATRLYTHNADVDRINAGKLSELATPLVRFWMTGKGNPRLIEALKSNCLSPEELLLKEGAVVMCTKNNFDVGFVNGTLGTIVEFASETGNPVIETLKGVRIEIEPMEWSVEDGGKVIASVSQMPLRLAWAITVHKSQGMTLDAAIIDLSSAFEYGQGYVALSRVRSLSGMSLLGITQKAFQVHPAIIEKDTEFRVLSIAADDSFGTIPQDELLKMHEHFVAALGGTIPKPGALKVAKKKGRANGAMSSGSTFEETLTLFRQGKSIGDIAEVRGLAWSTIAGHIEKLAEKGKLDEGDIPQLMEMGKISKDELDEIVNASAALDTNKLTPLYEHFKEKYSYETLHLARALSYINK